MEFTKKWSPVGDVPMKIIGLLEAKVDKSPLGLESRVLERVAGKPVILYAFDGLKSVDEIDDVYIVCRPEEKQKLKSALGNGFKNIFSTNASDLPQREGFIRGRKWALSSWRGGVNNSYYFCEEGNPNAFYEAAKRAKAEVIVKVSASSPFVDRIMISKMISQYEEKAKEFMFLISQAPPGFSYELLGTNLIADLGKTKNAIDSFLKLRLEEPVKDPITQDFCLPLPEKIISCDLRLKTDTKRGFELIRSLAEKNGEEIFQLSAEEVVELINKNQNLTWEGMPEEIDIEICTKNSINPVTMSVDQIHSRECMMSLENFKTIIDNIMRSHYDDIKITIGIFGEPLEHPELMNMIEYAKDKGVFGIHINSNGVHLDSKTAERICEIDVDMISVHFGCFEPKTYDEIMGSDSYEKVLQNCLNFLEIRDRSGKDYPFLVPEIVKIPEVEDQIEEFFDFWYEKTGWAVIRGFNDRAGQIEDRSVIHLTPGMRGVCKKLRKRLIIFPNGDIPICEQDFKCSELLGKALKDSVQEIWNSDRLETLRQAHLNKDFSRFKLCESCKDWGCL